MAKSRLILPLVDLSPGSNGRQIFGQWAKSHGDLGKTYH
jgi:hypothetical protein